MQPAQPKPGPSSAARPTPASLSLVRSPAPRTSRAPATSSSEETDEPRVVVGCEKGMPVAYIASGPNKGQSICLDHYVQEIYPPSPEFELNPRTAALGPLVDKSWRSGYNFERWGHGQRSSLYRGQFPVLPPRAPIELIMRKDCGGANATDNLKWQRFFDNQSVENLLKSAIFACSEDLVRVRKSLRTKLGMNTERPWVIIRLPLSFVTILTNLTVRAYDEVNNAARVMVFKILYDMAQRYEHDIVPFHNDIGLNLALDLRFNYHHNIARQEKSSILVQEFKILNEIQGWLLKTYDEMMVHWMPLNNLPTTKKNKRGGSGTDSPIDSPTAGPSTSFPPVDFSPLLP